VRVLRALREAAIRSDPRGSQRRPRVILFFYKNTSWRRVGAEPNSALLLPIPEILLRVLLGRLKLVTQPVDKLLVGETPLGNETLVTRVGQ
jgi:hypothetical protein